MTKKKQLSEINAVFSANSQYQLTSFYDRWAKSYDRDMDNVGYRNPSICLALLSRYLENRDLPILDAGVGTGLVAELANIIGFKRFYGIDLSEGMLAIARAKNLYIELHQADMTRPLELPKDYFSAIISSGVFTTGHVGKEGIRPLVNVCKPNGFLVISIKTSIWKSQMESELVFLEKQGLLKIREKTINYNSMPGEEGTTPSIALVLQKL